MNEPVSNPSLFADHTPLTVIDHDGLVVYFGAFLSNSESDAWYQDLLAAIPWQSDQVQVAGQRITTARQVAWFGDQHFAYRYSGVTRVAQAWLPKLAAVRERLYQQTGHMFNSCLANLYAHGGEGMAWHSDSERTLVRHGLIASVSFGAERRFAFKHKQRGDTHSVRLEHGSLLIMQGETQEHWLHRVPPMKAVTTPRINLTFRQFNGPVVV